MSMQDSFRIAVIFHVVGVAFAQSLFGTPAAVVNPANQEAARALQTALIGLLAPKVEELTPCRNCGIENRYGVNLLRIRATLATQPAASCVAQQGSSVTCSLNGASLQIDGTWIVGDYIWASNGLSQPRGVPSASGNYWISVRNYNPVWRGEFTQSLSNTVLGRPGASFSFNDLRFSCSQNDTTPADALFQFGITRTSGMMTRQIYSFVESLARKEVINYFCTAIRWASSGSYISDLGSQLQQQMTWQNVAPSQWIE